MVSGDNSRLSEVIFSDTLAAALTTAKKSAPVIIIGLPGEKFSTQEKSSTQGEVPWAGIEAGLQYDSRAGGKHSICVWGLQHAI